MYGALLLSNAWAMVAVSRESFDEGNHTATNSSLLILAPKALLSWATATKWSASTLELTPTALGRS